MALIPSEFKEKMASSFKGIPEESLSSPAKAWDIYTNALCDYFEEYMELEFKWVASGPPPASTPDSVTEIKCKVKCPDRTSFKQPSGNVIAIIFRDFNENFGSFIQTFIPEFPSPFLITPLSVFTPGWMTLKPLLPMVPFTEFSFQMTASYKTDVDAALLHLATEMISGLKNSMIWNVSPMLGNRAVTYNGSAILSAVK